MAYALAAKEVDTHEIDAEPKIYEETMESKKDKHWKNPEDEDMDSLRKRQKLGITGAVEK